MMAATIPVPLPGGATWLQRATPDPVRFERWRRTLQDMAKRPGSVHVRAYERMHLLAAYDAGWDVRGADGKTLPPPRKLSLRGWNAVPRDVIEAMLDHLDRQAQEGLVPLQAQQGGDGDA